MIRIFYHSWAMLEELRFFLVILEEGSLRRWEPQMVQSVNLFGHKISRFVGSRGSALNLLCAGEPALRRRILSSHA